MGATWEELGAAALARQFPVPTEPLEAAGVAGAVRRIGPIQSQTARSPFLGLAARFPGVTHEAVTAAYEDWTIVRGSTLRGTVHTTVPEHHPLLEVATRQGQRGNWVRLLKLTDGQVDELWASTEQLARDEWRTPAELLDQVRVWALAHGGEWPAALDGGMGRYLGFGHGGLLRRPLDGRWEGQGAPVYRTASAVLGDRSEALGDPHALDELFRVHLAAHGPASRHDLAWWSGQRLGDVDAVLARLDLGSTTGPDGRAYVDLPGAPAPRVPEGVTLLPEYDALFCAYDPPARARFVTKEHNDRLWLSANGVVRPPILVDGRLTGHWSAGGSARRRPLEVTYFAGTRRPRKSELEEPVAALEAALAIEITSASVVRA
ncbi:MAG: AlkZ family DNA glycosylase [Marmoricola sp.]|nr:AlkZ family DNA glycosylase [Marmoricola sp.]